ncbi:MAG TPA: trypsin-like serine protease [Pseudonocardiaceae bacterium]
MRGTIGMAAVLLLALLILPASVVVPNTSHEAQTGVRQVSRNENQAAAGHWTPQQQAAAPIPTTTAAAAQALAVAPASGSDQPLGPGVPAVGALFTVGADGLTGHYCTASVVNSAAGDLVLTAAHCIHDGAGGDYRSNIVFVPGYHDGQDPYGVWTPSQLVVDPRWISDSDDDLDFGFLVVHKQGSTESVQQAAGANRVGTNLGYDLPVRVTGYPIGSEQPTNCQKASRAERQFQLRFDCAGFSDGTSGGPWVTDVDPATGLGVVVGVIGGYQTGGYTSDTSYSSYFDDDIQHLYDTAVATSG